MIKKEIKIIFFTLISSLLSLYAYSIENKIEYKVNNEIITSVDIKNEIKFLTSFNPKLLELDKNKILEISTQSIIKEKIKKIEIEKYKKLEINQNYLSKIIENNYKKINLKSESEFMNFLKRKNLKYDEFKEKLIIESLWNEIIFFKFKSQVTINEKKLKEELLKFNNREYTAYNLSEILFNLDSNEKFEYKSKLIKKEIEDKGFENTASLHSISSTSNLGGKLGWVEENSINETLRKKISKLSIGEFTDPQVIPGGYLIIKLNDIKKNKKEINIDKELVKLIQIKTNEQLNQFSNIYFKKVKKDIKIEKI